MKPNEMTKAEIERHEREMRRLKLEVMELLNREKATLQAMQNDLKKFKSALDKSLKNTQNLMEKLP